MAAKALQGSLQENNEEFLVCVPGIWRGVGLTRGSFDELEDTRCGTQPQVGDSGPMFRCPYCDLQCRSRIGHYSHTRAQCHVIDEIAGLPKLS